MCLWPGRAAQPDTPAAPACQPQLLPALARLRFISASLLPSYLQDQPAPHASRLCRFPFFSILLQQALAWRWHFYVPDPWQWALHVGWLVRMCGIPATNGSKGIWMNLLRRLSLFLEKPNHLGKYPPEWFAPLPILLLYWSSGGTGWGQGICKLFSPIHKKRVCRGTQAINLHLLKEKKLKTLKQFIAF